MIENMSEAEMSEFLEAYQNVADEVECIKYGSGEKGMLKTLELENLMKVMGDRTATELELKEIVRKLDVENFGAVDFPGFLAFMADRMVDSDLEERESGDSLRSRKAASGCSSQRKNKVEQEILGAFRMFDTDCTGTVLAKDLKELLTKAGFFGNEEISALLKDAEDPVTPDKIIYNKFLAFLSK